MTTGVLILCTHNSARSVLGEGMLNHLARNRGRDVRGFSAGSAPSGRINPAAIEVLSRAGVDTTRFRSKSWDEFASAGAPTLRVVITVCDDSAAEACPFWPGSPVKAHWGYPDPSRAPEEGRLAAFELTRQALGYRLSQLVDLPFDTMTNEEIQCALDLIGRS